MCAIAVLARCLKIDAEKTRVLWLDRDAEQLALRGRGVRDCWIAAHLSTEVGAVLANTEAPMRPTRSYSLPISELISEGNVGLMQAVKRFEPEKGFRLATYAMWWIKAAIQEYILHSWSLVKMGTTINQKKLFFNLRKAKSKISVLDEGDLRPDQVKLIARRLGVTEQDVVDMNRRVEGDVSLDAPICEDGNPGEWRGCGGG